MAKGLAEALMGEITLLKPHRGRVAVERPGAGSKGAARSGAASAAQRARLWRAGQGGHAAILKKIHRGGTHTVGQLGKQLDYLFSKAEWCGGNIVDYHATRRTLSPEERREIVGAWTDEWIRSPKNGQTTHLLMSLPQHVRPATARAIAADWAAEMFESGAHGDEWSYVAALHTDRAHPHVHIVVQNRGVLNGAWFYMAKDHSFNLAHMKERMAAIAEDHGVRLETTSRIERGILSYGPSRGEIEAARRVGQPVEEKIRTGEAMRVALEEVAQVSGAYQDLAFLARLTEAKDVAARMTVAATALAEGRPFIPHKTEVSMSSDAPVQSRSDFEGYFQDWRERMSERIATLAPADQKEMRPEFNALTARAMEALGDRQGAELARKEASSDLYRTVVRGDAVNLNGSALDLSPQAAGKLTAALSEAATAAGLDAAVVARRLERGAANALEERDWIKADVQAVAGKRSFDMGREEGRMAAAGIVDRFYEKASEHVAEARGVTVERAGDQLRRTLTAMSEVEARHGRVMFESEDAARGFASDMKTRYGEGVIKDLAAGKTQALEADFADPGIRTKVAKAVVAAAAEHEEIGLPLKEARAALERMRLDERREQSRDRDRDLER